MHQVIFSLRASRVSMTRTVPLMKGPFIRGDEKRDGALVVRVFGHEALGGHHHGGEGPFMSAAPRPYSMPSWMVGSNGGCATCRAARPAPRRWAGEAEQGPSLPRRAQRLVVSSKHHGLDDEAKLGETLRHQGLAPSSRGVTEGRRIRSWPVR